MKKTYTTPTLVESGEVIELTRIGDMKDVENTPLARDSLAGSVGYYL